MSVYTMGIRMNGTGAVIAIAFVIAATVRDARCMAAGASETSPDVWSTLHAQYIPDARDEQPRVYYWKKFA